MPKPAPLEFPGSNAINPRVLGLFMHAALLFSALVAVCFAPAAIAKEKEDLIVSGGTVVTMDAQRRVIADGAVVVRGDSVVAVGSSAEIEARYEAAKKIDARGAIVMPGLINGHAHAAMSLFRGIAIDRKSVV